MNNVWSLLILPYYPEWSDSAGYHVGAGTIRLHP
jgi:hypothetical protein